MYDPDRSQTVLHGNDTSTWGNFVKDMTDVMSKQTPNGGDGLYVLTGTVTSPTVVRLMGELLKKYPKARWHQHETVGRRGGRAAAMELFGRDVEPVYHFDRASVVLSLDSNFLADLPGSMAYAKQFINRRRVRQGPGELDMNRLYVAEPSVTITGAKADHRLPVKGGDVEDVARQVAAAMAGPVTGKYAAWAKAVADDLKAAGTGGLVIAGDTQPAAVHAIAYAINEQLGSTGPDGAVTFVDHIDAYDPKTGPLGLEALVADLTADKVEVLVIMGTNPCFTAPPSMGLRNGLTETTPDERKGSFEKDNPLHKAGLVVHHGLYGPDADETAVFAQWHVPASHYLEMWGDLRAHDGSPSLVQPLIAPLYSSKSEVELLSFLIGHDEEPAYDTVKATWEAKYASAMANAPAPMQFPEWWDRSVERGVFIDAAGKSMPVKRQDVTAKVKLAEVLAAATTAPSTRPASSNGMEVCFRVDPSVWDGRYANLGWLQELPKPISLLTWDTAAFMSLTTAAKMKILPQDQGRGLETSIVKVQYQGRELAVPALVMPGHADDSITIYLGYGRVRGGNVTQRASGSDGFVIRPAIDAWAVPGMNVVKQDDAYLLATSQSHHLIDIPAKDRSRMDDYWIKERELIHAYTLAELQAGDHVVDGERVANGPPSTRPAAPHRKIGLPIYEAGTDRIEVPAEREEISKDETLLPAWKYDYNKWGMVIDNQACIGCNACVTACQSENNIAIVGKDMVLRGRIMLWLRIDTYFDGESHGNPNVYFQPIPCMHCENAPCTLVCPVEATTISAEGINEMTYNRCVGTRYCSNNCPYKVRRFNFMQWTDYTTPQFMLQRNPNVTVRARGVMEKCNYCVQRINNGRIEAKKLDRPINPGEVVTACQQSCPTDAISFGNLNDPRWEVTKLQQEPLRYTLLDELNTLPRTSYLPRVSNPNPAMPAPHYGDAEMAPADPPMRS